MAKKRFSLCFIIFVAVLGSIECNRDRIFSKLLDEFEQEGVSEKVVKLLVEEVTHLTEKEGNDDSKTIRKQRELTSSLFIICLLISKQCHVKDVFYDRVNNAFENLRAIGTKLDYGLTIWPVSEPKKFLLNIDSFMDKTKNGIEKKTRWKSRPEKDA